MAGTIIVDRLESDASYASSINIASPLVVANSSTFTSDMTLTKATPYLYITSTGGTNQNFWMKDNANNTFAIESQPKAQGGVFLSNRTAAAPIYVRSANTGGTLVTSAILNQFGIGLGDSTPQSGMGIRFPATQNASSDANTLDDYEEGTFTPTFLRSGSNPSLTYDQQEGVYIKIGRFVFFMIRMGVNSVSNQGSGDLWIGGIPFLPVAGAGGDIGLSYTWSVSLVGAKWYTGSGQSYLNIYKDDNAAGQYSGSLFSGGGSRIFFYGTYHTS